MSTFRTDFRTDYITGEGVRTLAVYRSFYTSALREALAADASYEAEVVNWYESGDGVPRERGGRGYSFPHCRHGVSRWDDYDCACWWCEAGEDAATQRARGIARDRFMQFVEAFDWLVAMPHSAPQSLRAAVEKHVRDLWK